MVTRCIAELLGTFALVFAAAGANMVEEMTGGQVTPVGVGLTTGLIVAVVISAIGHISGAHINPAVTLGFALARHFPWREVPLYWVAQLAGAIVGSLVLRALFGLVADMGATIPAGDHYQSLGLEVVLTFLLMFVIMAVATDVRAVGQVAALTIGATVSLEAMFAGPISGASMNPARSLGPALVSMNWSAHWVYWAGPLVGAAAGAMTYRSSGLAMAAGQQHGTS